jgi:hypothetical protein
LRLASPQQARCEGRCCQSRASHCALWSWALRSQERQRVCCDTVRPTRYS